MEVFTNSMYDWKVIIKPNDWLGWKTAGRIGINELDSSSFSKWQTESAYLFNYIHVPNNTFIINSSRLKEKYRRLRLAKNSNIHSFNLLLLLIGKMCFHRLRFNFAAKLLQVFIPGLINKIYWNQDEREISWASLFSISKSYLSNTIAMWILDFICFDIALPCQQCWII